MTIKHVNMVSHLSYPALPYTY